MRSNPRALALVLATAACGVSEPETTRSDAQRLTPQVDPAVLKSVVHDDTELALDLYRRILDDKPNLIYSPHSISSAVAMLWAGARTTSETEIATALHFGRPQAEQHAAFNHLDQALAARNDTVDDSDAFILKVVNDVWAQRGFAVQPGYLDVLAQNYGAGVRRVDFAGDPSGTRELINDWIADQTEDRILDLFPEGAINGQTVMALTNAIYFKADWADAFDPSESSDGAFALAGGGTKSVRFMHRTAGSRFVRAESHVAVELPYKGDEVALLVIMPDDLGAFEASMSAQTIEDIAGSLRDGQVELSLPKWTHETSVDLEPALSGMGMPGLFSAGADLSGIDGTRDLFVQAVVHKAFIEVSEEGTEAAAATGISVGLVSLPPAPVQIRIDRPFVYLLRDRATGAVLFLGRVGDPSGR